MAATRAPLQGIPGRPPCVTSDAAAKLLLPTGLTVVATTPILSPEAVVSSATQYERERTRRDLGSHSGRPSVEVRGLRSCVEPGPLHPPALVELEPLELEL